MCPPVNEKQPLPPTRKMVPKTRKKRRERRSKKLSIMLAGCLLLCLLAVGAGYALSRLDDTLETVTDDPYKLPDQPNVEQPYEEKKALSFVIVGLDTRKNIGMMNTDVLMVAVANPVTHKMTMVSLPRDTRVQIPGYPGYHKINEVFALGEDMRKRAESKKEPVTENGMTLLKKTVEHMLGISVGHYVQLDFEGFSAVIDKLGGVQVNVDRDLVYELPQEGIYRRLNKGTQVLNGEQALGFVRHRLDKRGPAYYSSDFDRNRRQQEVIKAVADKVVSLDGLSNLTDLLDTVGKHIRTDLSKDQIKGLALDFGKLSSDQIVTLDNGAVWNSQISYTLWHQENMQAVRTALQKELGVAAETEKLSDAAIAELAKAEPQSKPKSTADASAKPKQQPPKKGQDAGSPASTHTTKPGPSKPSSTVPDTDSSHSQDGQAEQPAPSEQQPNPADMPPPDILAPSSPVPDAPIGI